MGGGRRRRRSCGGGRCGAPVSLRGSCFCCALTDARQSYGQKQEGACQLHDPHKTQQEILAGSEREKRRLPSLFSALPFILVPLIYPVESKEGRKATAPRKGSRGVRFFGRHIKRLVRSADWLVYHPPTPPRGLLTGWFIVLLSR